MENTTVKTEFITIPVDAETARVYQAVSEDKKRKIVAFLNFQLRKALKPRESLQEAMDKLAQEAQANGLTPEILQAILDDE
ncbi:hypothetical protein C7H19_17465 [Aphanothece hegewaldii CCALA 016]|uniref:Uncharacterized protein n=1 Tax=Aphanothece hegewaldii CCALA 016 TaxID=2107694 RepID=A0A2T1LUF4_9CHRO|nr:hypothetical protein [Aphanothece hegewaldii]PSF35171.1 hypothetical protein C7H19_17465 [Aphanothece hegewaldii CCALA 016]